MHICGSKLLERDLRVAVMTKLIASVNVVLFFKLVKPAEMVQDGFGALLPLGLFPIINDEIHGLDFRLVFQEFGQLSKFRHIISFEILKRRLDTKVSSSQ